MPLYFVSPTIDSARTVRDVLKYVSRLDGIMTALRQDCTDTADILYLEIATRDTPIPTVLLDDFRESETTPKVFESIDIFESRIRTAIRIAMQMGENVAVVAPPNVIRQWTGITLEPGEVYEYSDEYSYYERCDKELDIWNKSNLS